MSRSRFYKLRQEKKRRKLQVAQDGADCQYAKILLSNNKMFRCNKCFWFKGSNILLTARQDWYWEEDRCMNKFRSNDIRGIALPIEKFCGYFKKREM